MVNVETPFSVDETEVRTLTAGDGPVVAPTANVSVCYMGVDGRDGHVFDSSYERGAPVDFPSRSRAGLPESDRRTDGRLHRCCRHDIGRWLPAGQPRAGIEPGDSLIFAIKIPRGKLDRIRSRAPGRGVFGS